jgi:hypothetical protein
LDKQASYGPSSDSSPKKSSGAQGELNVLLFFSVPFHYAG